MEVEVKVEVEGRARGSSAIVAPENTETRVATPPRTPWVVLVFALVLTAFAWVRVGLGGWVTAAREFAWDGDCPLPATGISEPFVFRDRVIVRCVGGWAWLDPRTGDAKLAWRLPANVTQGRLVGIAAKESPSSARLFAVAFDNPDGLYAGVANPEGWTMPPTKLADKYLTINAMAWIGSRFELVVRLSDEEVVVIGLDRKPIHQPIFNIGAALPSPEMWRFIDKNGQLIHHDTSVPAPQIAWLVNPMDRADRAAIGVVDHGNRGANMWLDGAVYVAEDPPYPKYKPTMRRFEFEGGLMRSVWTWGRQGAPDALYFARHPFVFERDGDILKVGDRPARMWRVAKTEHSFQGAVVMWADDGFYLVARDAYVRLDGRLRRTDHLSIVGHLGVKFIPLAWTLIGLPIAFAIGIVLRRRAKLTEIKRDRLELAVAAYVATGVVTMIVALS